MCVHIFGIDETTLKIWWQWWWWWWWWFYRYTFSTQCGVSDAKHIKIAKTGAKKCTPNNSKILAMPKNALIQCVEIAKNVKEWLLVMTVSFIVMSQASDKLYIEYLHFENVPLLRFVWKLSVRVCVRMHKKVVPFWPYIQEIKKAQQQKYKNERKLCDAYKQCVFLYLCNCVYVKHCFFIAFSSTYKYYSKRQAINTLNELNFETNLMKGKAHHHNQVLF